MHDELWAGVNFKLQSAEFHYEQMGKSLQRPVATAHEAMGLIPETGWQRSFPAYLDAFLSVTRSVPDVIKCCFGVDTGNKTMREWFSSLTDDERHRRNLFDKGFKLISDRFRLLPLSEARNKSVHRSGYPDMKMRVSGMMGVIYEGSPVNPVPTSETQQTDPEYSWLVKPRPVYPMPDQFTIDGEPLFSVCQDYINHAKTLINEARTISDREHGTESLTPPP